MDFPYAPTAEGTEARSRVGSTLVGKWRLDEILGVGGMGAVYSATHRNGARSAVKVLHRSCSEDPVTRQRFRREGHIANQLAHVGAVRVLDDDVAPDGSAFLVMELLEGRALNDLVEDAGGRLDAASVLCFTDRVLTVLAAAHELGIVHRDIKPENVFLTHAGVVKVLDFGIAGTAEVSTTHRCATQTGTPMGTPAFMSPEQALGRWEDVGPASDIWATGAMMFSMLSGELVHPEPSVAEILAALVTRPARSVAKATRGIPLAVVAVVDRALAAKPASRWPSARAMQSAVRDAYRVVYSHPMPLGALSGMASARRDGRAHPVQPRVDAGRVSTGPSSCRAHVLERTLESARAPVPPTRRHWPRTAGVAAFVAAALVTTLFVGVRARGVSRAAAAQPLAYVGRSISASTPPHEAPSASCSPGPAAASAEAAPTAPAPVTSPTASTPRIRRHASAATNPVPAAVAEPTPILPAVATQPAHDIASLFDRRH